MPKIKKQGTNLETEREMGGIGGPLLTIGDLLSDVGEENVTPPDIAPLSSIQDSNNTSHQLDLTKLFQVLLFSFLFINYRFIPIAHVEKIVFFFNL